MTPLLQRQLHRQELSERNYIIGDRQREKKAQVCILMLGAHWGRTTPTPVSEASTSITNCFSRLGRVRTGAEKKQFFRSWKTASALGVQVKVVLDVREERGVATEL